MPEAIAPKKFSCPSCGELMKVGSVSLESTRMDFVGAAYTVVSFSGRGGKRQRVLDAAHDATGFICPKCGVVAFESIAMTANQSVGNGSKPSFWKRFFDLS